MLLYLFSFQHVHATVMAEFSIKYNCYTSGAEKSGENAEGDSWWEKWKEVMYQDEWR
jgi:hypothetical protein